MGETQQVERRGAVERAQPQTGRGQPGQRAPAGDDRDAARPVRQQWPDLVLARGVVQQNHRPAAAQQLAISRRPAAQVERGDPARRLAEHPQEPVQHRRRVSRREVRVEPAQVDRQPQVRVVRRQPVSQPHRQSGLPGAGHTVEERSAGRARRPLERREFRGPPDERPAVVRQVGRHVHDRRLVRRACDHLAGLPPLRGTGVVTHQHPGHVHHQLGVQPAPPGFEAAIHGVVRRRLGYPALLPQPSDPAVDVPVRRPGPGAQRTQPFGKLVVGPHAAGRRRTVRRHPLPLRPCSRESSRSLIEFDRESETRGHGRGAWSRSVTDHEGYS